MRFLVALASLSSSLLFADAGDSRTASALIRYKIVPDIIPSPPQNQIYAPFSSGAQVSLGNTLSPGKVCQCGRNCPRKKTCRRSKTTLFPAPEIGADKDLHQFGGGGYVACRPSLSGGRKDMSSASSTRFKNGKAQKVPRGPLDQKKAAAKILVK